MTGLRDMIGFLFKMLIGTRLLGGRGSAIVPLWESAFCFLIASRSIVFEFATASTPRLACNYLSFILPIPPMTRCLTKPKRETERTRKVDPKSQKVVRLYARVRVCMCAR